MMSFSDDKHADIIGALNTISRYLDDILNINNVYFDSMVGNKANTSDTEASFFCCFTCFFTYFYYIVSIKIYDKQ